jgi:hypothetical protein
MAAERPDLWLWVITVVMAAFGGVSSVLGSWLRGRTESFRTTSRLPDRLVVAGYIFMTISISVFIVRGFL